MQLGRPRMLAVPNEPREGHAAVTLAAFPAIAEHHWQTLAEDVDTREVSGVENGSAPLTLQKCEAQQHHHARRQLQRVSDELTRKLKRRVRDDRLASIGRPQLHQEVAAV